MYLMKTVFMSTLDVIIKHIRLINVCKFIVIILLIQYIENLILKRLLVHYNTTNMVKFYIIE